MNDMKKYLIWIVVVALILGGGFFVYKKLTAGSMMQDQIQVGRI